eukprot:FR741812.1.p3 GENE.FR741812.1~~FR741812.1.p3  ORF type:complete len:138 (+),score=19.49 FR741812.1:737-1150(+)
MTRCTGLRYTPRSWHNGLYGLECPLIWRETRSRTCVHTCVSTPNRPEQAEMGMERLVLRKSRTLPKIRNGGDFGMAATDYMLVNGNVFDRVLKCGLKTLKGRYPKQKCFTKNPSQPPNPERGVGNPKFLKKLGGKPF